MRLKPAAANTTAKIATRDIVLGGRYKVPKGVTISVLGYATFRDPALWDRPNDFVPVCPFQSLHEAHGSTSLLSRDPLRASGVPHSCPRCIRCTSFLSQVYLTPVTALPHSYNMTP